MDNNVTNESINQSMNIFMTERGPTDIDLVGLVHRELVEYLGNIAGEEFITSPEVSSVLTALPEVQRVIINRYFITKLFRFRYYNNIDVLGPLSNLISDGTYTDWFYCFKTYVMPFLKENNVLTTLK